MPHETATETTTSRDAARLLRIATLASVAAALLLVAAKLFAYLQTGAVSVLASLLDSLMDAVASIVNFVAVRYALKPPDDNHRFGHGKAESLAALLQAGFILTSGVFLIHEALHRLVAPEELVSLRAGVVVMLFAMLVTASLISLQRYVVTRTRSTAIEADSLHYRVDLLSNGATLLALLLAHFGIARADPLLALLIAVYLLVSTRAILRRALNELLDRELPSAQRNRISEIAASHPEVLGVHDLRTRRSGRTAVVQMHLEMNAELPLREAHRVSDEVERAILQAMPDADVVIHQDPQGLEERQRWRQDA